jgi:fibronectin-binding autotransporter adhesin
MKMKTNVWLNFKNLYAILAMVVIIAGNAQAATLTWDSTAGGVINDGAGAWLDVGQWNNGSPSATWTSGDDAIFGNAGTAGAVTLAGPTVANSLKFNPFSGTYTLGTSGQALTLTNGLTMNSGAGAVTIVSPITLGAAQSWVNNSASLLTVGTDTVSKASYLLNIDGSGNTTVSGIIDGAGGLAKNGAGTLTLNGTNANTFTGGLNITNGTVVLDFVSRGANANLVDTGNALILASGTLQLKGNSATNSAQTLGNVTLAPGAAQILVDPNGAARTATLTLGTIPTNTAGTTLLIGKVSGAAGTNIITTTTDKDATGIYGGRVVYFNGTANTGYDFATNSGAGTYTLTNYAGYTTLPTAATSDTLNDQMTGNTTLAGAQTHNTLKIGSGLTLANGGFNTVLTAGGLLSVGSAASTISGTGTLTADNGSGAYELLIHQYNSGGLTISSVITNNGANAVALVKSGSGALTLSGANTFSGGTVINAGTLNISADSNLGNSAGGITFNGNATLANSATITSARSITVNNGATATMQMPSQGINSTYTGGLSGNGTLVVYAPNSDFLTLSGGGLFTGTLWIQGQYSSSGSREGLIVNSTNLLADVAAPIKMGTLGIANGTVGAAGTLALGTGVTGPLTFNNRWIEMNNYVFLENMNTTAGNTLTINTPFFVNATSASTLYLGGVVNNGANVLAGRITDGPGSGVVSLNLNGSPQQATFGSTATWILSGANTYSGGTTVSGGTLGLSNNLALGTGPLTFSAASTLQAAAPALAVTNVITINSGISGTIDTLANALTWSGVIRGAGNLIKAGSGTMTLANANTFTGTTTVNGGTLALSTNQALQSSALVTTGAGRLTLGAGVTTPTLGGLSGASGNLSAIITNGYDSVTALTLNPGSAVSYSGIISNGAAGMTLTKTGAGTQTLAGNNAYSGATTINAGTLSVSTLANGGLVSGIGQSANSAANLLINGGTLMYSGSAATSTDRGFTIGSSGASLDASGTGTGTLLWNGAPVYDVADVARSLTLTGTQTGTNTFAATIANNGAGAVSVTKAGVGTWLLTGNNAYAGGTTLSAGKLMVSVANNLGSGGNLVFNGGTLSITNTTLNSFSSLGHPIVCNPGVSVNLEIASAGNTFTNDLAITGSVSVVKSGPGTLVFSTNNSYSGVTTISSGVLQYNDGPAIPTTPLYNSGALVINRTDTLTQGSTFHSIMMGTGSLTNIGSGTLALNNINTYSGITKAAAGTIALRHPLALWNSAIDTTGSGVFTFSGAGTNGPTIGGLTQSGTPRDLASVFTTGYSSVTNLILNPSGSVTYGGVIGNGASGMALTMAGTGTQVLTNSNTYTGATYINAGTLTLGGIGDINTSSGIVIQGGTLTSTRSTTGITPFGANSLDFRHGTLSLVPASAGAYAFTGVNAAVGSTLTYSGGAILGLTRNGANTLSYTIGNAGAGANSVLVRSGNGTLVIQPTALANMGGSAAGSENFIINNQTTASNMNGASSGTGIYDASVVGLASSVGSFLSYGTGVGGLGAGFALASYSTAVNASTIGANTISDVTSSIGINDTSNPYALRVGAFTLTLTGTTTVNGGTSDAVNSGLGGVILNSTATASTITGGTLAFGSSEGVIFAASSGAGSGTIASKITGTAGITKFGPGTLVLSNVTSDFTGGVRINQGTLSIGADTNLGNTGNGITFNGSATLWCSTAFTTSRAITLNNGAIASIYNPASSTLIINGAVTGNGGVTWGNTTQNTGHNIQFNSTGNTFTGPLTVGVGGANTTSAMTMNSIADRASQLIMNGGGQGVSWTYGAGAIAPLTFNNRQIVLKTSDQSTIANASSYALTNNIDLGFSGTGARNLTLAGAGGGTFNGRLTDNAGGALSLTFGGGTWNLSATNTYSGNTSVNNATAVFQGKQALSPNSTLRAAISGANFKILDDGAGTINYGNTVAVPLNYNIGVSATFFVGNNNTANGGTSAGATMGSTMVFGTLDMTITDSRSRQTVNFQGANGYQIQFGNMIIPGAYGREDTGSVMLAPSTAAVTITGTVQQANGRFDNPNPVNGLGLAGSGVGTISGTIKDAADYTDLSNANARPLALTKSSTSEWILSGTNTYTGITKISGGTLQANPGIGLPSASYLQLDGGVLQAAGTFTRVNSTTVNGANMQWLTANGGGFSARGGKLTVTINNSASTEQVWGAAVGNDTIWGTLKFGSGTANSEVEFQNNINLAAATRTVDVASGTGGDSATLSGVIRTASGTAGITKTGTGTLVLSGANTYNGATTISADGGTLAVSSIANVASPNPLGQSTAVAASLLLGNNTTLKYTGPTASTDRSFTIAGTAAGHQATLDASGTGAITFANTASPAYGTTAQTRVLKLTGSNTDNNTLAANLPNNGTGAVSIQKSGAGTWVISGSNTYSGTTTVDFGTLRLGGMNALPTNTTVVIGAGTLDMAGYTKTVNTLDVTGAGTINLDAGGKLVFADSNAKLWSGGTLRITGTFVSGSSIKFATSGGLNATQLAKISSPGVSSFTLDGSGYLVAIRPTLILFL